MLQLFYKISCLVREKKQYQINLRKTYYMKKPFRHSKIQDTKRPFLQKTSERLILNLSLIC